MAQEINNEYNFNEKIYHLAFPSFKRHNKFQKLLKEYGDTAYDNFDNVKEMLELVFQEKIELTEDDVSYGQVAGAIQDFFSKSMEMNKK